MWKADFFSGQIGGRTCSSRHHVSDALDAAIGFQHAAAVWLDGSKALYTTVRRHASESAFLQRRQVHKKRNVVDHLPEEHKADVRRKLQNAYSMTDDEGAKRALERLHHELMHLNPSAARSLEEGLEENQSGNPGWFAVIRDGEYLHIQQTMRTLDGDLEPFEPISNTVVSWESESTTCQQVLSHLSSALRQVRGVGLAEGNIPAKALLMKHCTIEGSSLTIGQILGR